MSLLDFLFPPICPHCGGPVVMQGDWCESCISDVLHIRQVPQKFLESLDKAWILADYRGGIKSMIYDVKFNEKKEQSKGAAPFLASYNLYVHEYKPHYIIPIPSSAEKKKVRGYNQVDLFFKEWASKHFVWLDCLYKMNTHKEMWSLTGTERLETAKHAFLWNANYDEAMITHKRVLLVDDIYTTGATLEAAASVLRKSNPASIEAMTLASGSF